jgi:hypothetical protein
MRIKRSFCTLAIDDPWKSAVVCCFGGFVVCRAEEKAGGTISYCRFSTCASVDYFSPIGRIPLR